MRRRIGTAGHADRGARGARDAQSGDAFGVPNIPEAMTGDHMVTV
ncbi:MAG TPA: hypothetical protein VKV15_02960 [Bryobacteraceae bacterium]|nr:hypothetical protein [Bryobacteraceae bacterium]